MLRFDAVSFASRVAGLALVVSAAAVACSSSDDVSGGPGGAADGGGAGDGAVGPGGGNDGAAPVDAQASGDGAAIGDGEAPEGGQAPEGGSDDGGPVPDGNVAAPLTVTSSAFADGQPLPGRHSCGAAFQNPHLSPPLAWTGGQAGAASYAVVMRDQTLNDAFHWVIWDIPAGTTSLPENVARVATPAAPAGAKQAVVAFSTRFGDGAPGYFYACPPDTDPAHTYTFTVYALPVAALPNVTTASTPAEVAAALVAVATDVARISATLER